MLLIMEAEVQYQFTTYCCLIPDTNTQLLREIFSEKHSVDETVRSQVMHTMSIV